ncbi:MFS general substrate transporter [Cyathus striatus]|nr:MFS general substrate transporter [Cyathus striatus]
MPLVTDSARDACGVHSHGHSLKSLPAGFKWRSSYSFATLVVGLGIATDLLVYSIIIPVMPFHLEALGYNDVPSLAGWLLFAYSGGLVSSTIPIAWFSEKYQARRWPLVLGLSILIGSQVMLMEAPMFTVMCIARVFQGIGSSMVWVVGLALLCDSVPENLVGRQLGLAMTGLSIGMVIGPPIGGAIYNYFGYRGPFIFGLCITAVDLTGRLLVIEKKDSSQQNHSTENKENETIVCEATPNNLESALAIGSSDPSHVSFISVIVLLAKSPRAMVAVATILVYGVVFTTLEPTLPLRLQEIWGLGPGKVGLIFFAAVIPTFISSPLSGYLSDRIGTGIITVLCLALSVPWWIVICVKGPLALFITSFALQSFFTSGTISPLTAELAATSRQIEGVGYAHVYGAFNLAYGIGNAVGPVVGGQLYDRVKHGWTALCLLSAALLVACVIPTFCITGDETVLKKWIHRKPETHSA